MDLLREIFAIVRTARASHSLGSLLQNPKIPQELSESIACHLIRDGVVLRHLSNATLRRCREADIIAEIESHSVRVEVKATAKPEFSYFYPKDVEADHLIWIAYANFFEDPTASSIAVLTLDDVKRHFSPNTKMTLPKFRRAAAGYIVETRYQLPAGESQLKEQSRRAS